METSLIIKQLELAMSEQEVADYDRKLSAWIECVKRGPYVTFDPIRGTVYHDNA